MNRLIIIGMMLIVIPVSLSAQFSVDSVIRQVDRNNTTLKALRKKAESEKIGNRTGIYLNNPEFEFNYLWGNPASIGNRTDISVRQTFDFPSAYSYRHQIAKTGDQLVELEFQKQRNDILLSARMLCTRIIYLNSLLEVCEGRHKNAIQLADSYTLMFEKGEVSILEKNKAKMNELNLRKEIETLGIERASLLNEIIALNAGIPLDLKTINYPEILLPPDFELWYAKAEQKNPQILMLNKEIEQSQLLESLQKAKALPKTSAGYMSEDVVGQHFRGVSVGISIPLWENKNQVNYARAKTAVVKSMETDGKQQLYSMLKLQYEKAVSLKEAAGEYRLLSEPSNNTELLKKALGLGEITLIEYLMEVSFSYDAIDKLMAIEFEKNKALSILNHYTSGIITAY